MNLKASFGDLERREWQDFEETEREGMG